MNALAVGWLLSSSVVLAALAAQPAWASASPSLGAVSQVGSAATPWWQAFQDPLLNGLIARSGGNLGGQQLSLVCSYIQLRVAQSRLALAGRLQDTVATQRQLLQDNAAPSAERQRWLDETAARQLHWAQMQGVMANERDAALAALAQHSGSSVEQLRALLQAAGSPAAVPQVQQALPAFGANAVQPVAWSTTSAMPQQLQVLLASAARAAQAQQVVQASQLELQSHQLRLQAGTESPLGALEAYQQLVTDADRLTALSGIMAVAWAEWLQADTGP